MTNDEIERVSQRVADLVLEGILQSADGVWHDNSDTEEQTLLTQLATAMTELDYNLQKENYSKCDELKKKILKLENKLNKFK